MSHKLWGALPEMVRADTSYFSAVNGVNNLNIIMIHDIDNLLLPLDRYHVPRSWLYPTGNYLVVFEEWGGDPFGITLMKRTVESGVCAEGSSPKLACGKV